MGNRLTRIYTRTGDQGTTALGAKLRVAKDDIRIESLGAVDELNSAIARVVSHAMSDNLQAMLLEIQHDLFDMGADLYIPASTAISADYVSRLEVQLDELNKELGPLKEFILPGGTAAAADCHFARTICRRCERTLTVLMRQHDINPEVGKYINRLSDLLFVIARQLNRDAGVEDVLWDRTRR